MKTFWLIILAIIVLACGGMEEVEMGIEPSWLTDKFEEDAPPVADWSAEEEEVNVTDEEVAQVWGLHPIDCQCWKCATAEMVAVPVVRLEDAPLHSDDAQFCSDETCPCHNDAAHYEYIERPILDGLLTTWEGSRLYWGEAI